ncbi:MAG: GntR family transcriptional regulator, partial [Firmicutes bacterium]|nr:GntR family transcriptional regulator [Bacillota bacterium]
MLNLDNKDHRPLRVLVYDEIKMRILKGEIAPGQRLMEVETAEDLGVS